MTTRHRSAPARRAQAAPAPDTRSRVLQAARAMIERRGDAALSLVELAAETGLSRQTLYLLFGTRAGLLLALVDHLDETSAGPARLTALREGLPAREAFEPYLRAWLSYLPTIRPVALALSAATTTGDADARSAWESRMTKLRGGFLMLTKGLKSAGSLRSGWTPEAAADWIFAQTHVDTWHHLVADCGWKPQAAADRIVEQLRATLLRAQAP